MASIYYTSFDPFLLMALPLFLWRCKEEYLDHRYHRHPRSLRRDRVRMRMTLGAVRHLGFLVLLNKYYKGRTMNPRFIRPIDRYAWKVDIVSRTAEFRNYSTRSTAGWLRRMQLFEKERQELMQKEANAIHLSAIRRRLAKLDHIIGNEKLLAETRSRGSTIPPQGGGAASAIPPNGGRTQSAIPPNGGRTHSVIPPHGGRAQSTIPPNGGRAKDLWTEQVEVTLTFNGQQARFQIAAGDCLFDLWKQRADLLHTRLTDQLGREVSWRTLAYRAASRGILRVEPRLRGGTPKQDPRGRDPGAADRAAAEAFLRMQASEEPGRGLGMSSSGRSPLDVPMPADEGGEFAADPRVRSVLKSVAEEVSRETAARIRSEILGSISTAGTAKFRISTPTQDARDSDDSEDTSSGASDDRRGQRKKSKARPRGATRTTTKKPRAKPTEKSEKSDTVEYSAGGFKIYLGSNAPDLAKFPEIDPGSSLINRYDTMADWLNDDLQGFILSAYGAGHEVWAAIWKASGEYHQTWVAKSANTLDQAEHDLSKLPKASSRGYKAFHLDDHEEFLQRAYERVRLKLPKDCKKELRAELRSVSLTSFQRLVALVAVLRRTYDIKSMFDRVNLLRKVEHPENWVTNISGPEWFVKLQEWQSLVNQADKMGHVAFDRVVLGVQALQRAVLSHLDDIEKRRVAAWGDHFNINSFTDSKVEILGYVRAIAQYARTSPKILAIKKEKPKDKEDKWRGGDWRAHSTQVRDPSQLRCFVCGKTLAEHPNGFCKAPEPSERRCFICNKTAAEHTPPGHFCPRPCVKCGKPKTEHMDANHPFDDGWGNGKGPGGGGLPKGASKGKGRGKGKSKGKGQGNQKGKGN